MLLQLRFGCINTRAEVGILKVVASLLSFGCVIVPWNSDRAAEIWSICWLMNVCVVSSIILLLSIGLTYILLYSKVSDF